MFYNKLKYRVFVGVFGDFHEQESLVISDGDRLDNSVKSLEKLYRLVGLFSEGVISTPVPSHFREI